MKMSPGASFFFLKMRSEGGVRSGREWKCWTPLGLPPGSGIRCSLPELMNRAIVNVSAPLEPTTMPAIADTARRFESTDHLSLDGDEKGGTIGETRETNLSCGRSTRPAVSSHGAAKESNLPSEGLPRRHGFEDHGARA